MKHNKKLIVSCEKLTERLDKINYLINVEYMGKRSVPKSKVLDIISGYGLD